MRRPRDVRHLATESMAGASAECAGGRAHPGRLRQGPAQLHQLLQHQRQDHRSPGGCPGLARAPAGAAVAGVSSRTASPCLLN